MRPLTHALIAAAALVASVSAAPRPAEAQAVVRMCTANQAGIVMRSRFTYTDWRGTRHTSRWVTLALGQRDRGTM